MGTKQILHTGVQNATQTIAMQTVDMYTKICRNCMIANMLCLACYTLCITCNLLFVAYSALLWKILRGFKTLYCQICIDAIRQY